MTRAYTEEYVHGLRREGQRKGKRIRDLEDALIAKAVTLECAVQGVPLDRACEVSTLGLDVTDEGVVRGAVEAVKAFRATL